MKNRLNKIMMPAKSSVKEIGIYWGSKIVLSTNIQTDLINRKKPRFIKEKIPPR